MSVAKGRRILVYHNGCPYFTSRVMLINDRYYRTFACLLEDVTRKVMALTPVTSLFTCGGDRVRTIGELVHGEAYVAVETHQVFVPLDYKGIEKALKERALTGPGTERLAQRNTAEAKYGLIEIPLIIHVYRNGDIFTPGKKFIFYSRELVLWEMALQRMSDELKLSTGCLMRLWNFQGKFINKVHEVEMWGHYVACGNHDDKFKALPYHLAGTEDNLPEWKPTISQVKQWQKEQLKPQHTATTNILETKSFDTFLLEKQKRHDKEKSKLRRQRSVPTPSPTRHQCLLHAVYGCSVCGRDRSVPPSIGTSKLDTNITGVALSTVKEAPSTDTNSTTTSGNIDVVGGDNKGDSRGTAGYGGTKDKRQGDVGDDKPGGIQHRMAGLCGKAERQDIEDNDAEVGNVGKESVDTVVETWRGGADVKVERDGREIEVEEDGRAVDIEEGGKKAVDRPEVLDFEGDGGQIQGQSVEEESEYSQRKGDVTLGGKRKLGKPTGKGKNVGKVGKREITTTSHIGKPKSGKIKSTKILHKKKGKNVLSSKGKQTGMEHDNVKVGNVRQEGVGPEVEAWRGGAVIEVEEKDRAVDVNEEGRAVHVEEGSKKAVDRLGVIGIEGDDGQIQGQSVEEESEYSQRKSDVTLGGKGNRGKPTGKGKNVGKVGKRKITNTSHREKPKSVKINRTKIPHKKKGKKGLSSKGKQTGMEHDNVRVGNVGDEGVGTEAWRGGTEIEVKEMGRAVDVEKGGEKAVDRPGVIGIEGDGGQIQGQSVEEESEFSQRKSDVTLAGKANLGKPMGKGKNVGKVGKRKITNTSHREKQKLEKMKSKKIPDKKKGKKALSSKGKHKGMEHNKVTVGIKGKGSGGTEVEAGRGGTEIKTEINSTVVEIEKDDRKEQVKGGDRRADDDLDVTGMDGPKILSEGGIEGSEDSKRKCVDEEKEYSQRKRDFTSGDKAKPGKPMGKSDVGKVRKRDITTTFHREKQKLEEMKKSKKIPDTKRGDPDQATKSKRDKYLIDSKMAHKHYYSSINGENESNLKKEVDGRLQSSNVRAENRLRSIKRKTKQKKNKSLPKPKERRKSLTNNVVTHIEKMSLPTSKKNRVLRCQIFVRVTSKNPVKQSKSHDSGAISCSSSEILQLSNTPPPSANPSTTSFASPLTTSQNKNTY